MNKPFFGSETLLEHPHDLDSPHHSEELLSGRKMQRVTFEEDEMKKLLDTPKPRHKPRRVKTDLGDHRGIITALQRKTGEKIPGT